MLPRQGKHNSLHNVSWFVLLIKPKLKNGHDIIYFLRYLLYNIPFFWKCKDKITSAIWFLFICWNDSMLRKINSKKYYKFAIFFYSETCAYNNVFHIITKIKISTIFNFRKLKTYIICFMFVQNFTDELISIKLVVL